MFFLAGWRREDDPEHDWAEASGWRYKMCKNTSEIGKIKVNQGRSREKKKRELCAKT